MFEHCISNMPNLYIALFAASITMAGLVAIFLVYRYQTLDNYVDSRKILLQSILKKKIGNKHDVLLKIQEVGKENYLDDIKYFENNCDLTGRILVKNILYYRKYRIIVMRLGFSSITIWSLLALTYLVIYIWFPSCCRDITWHANFIFSLFLLSLVFTLRYLYISIFALDIQREKHINIRAKKNTICSHLKKLETTNLFFHKKFSLSKKGYRTWRLSNKKNEKYSTLTIYEELITPDHQLISILYSIVGIYFVKIIQSISVCRQLREIKRSVEK